MTATDEFEVTAAATEREGRALLREQAFDLLIVDATTALALVGDAQGTTTKTLVLSATGEPHLRDLVRRKGAGALLVKPIEPEKLLGALRILHRG